MVIGIIAILISILLPALQRAREAAGAIKCAANLRSIGQGLASYEADNDDYLPVSYNYTASSIDAGSQTQTPNQATYGYTHWSAYVFSSTEAVDTFRCPALDYGGFPACDPLPGNFDNGQTTDMADAGTVPSPAVSAVTAVDGNNTSKTYLPDNQPIRMAYTLNEALCGRNVYVIGTSSTVKRTFHNVRATLVSGPTKTILATEFINEWGIVSATIRGGAAGAQCSSFRPVQPFRANNATAGDMNCDVTLIPVISGTKTLRQTNATDFYTTMQVPGGHSNDPISDYGAGIYLSTDWSTRLDWVGRNHGKQQFYPDGKTNFLYLDGHVELKTMAETVPANSTTSTPWDWGAVCYSLSNQY